MKRFFIKDGKPYITSTDVEYEIGKDDTNVYFQLSGDYTVSASDLREIIPLIGENTVLKKYWNEKYDFYGRMVLANFAYSFSSDSDIQKMIDKVKEEELKKFEIYSEELKKRYDGLKNQYEERIRTLERKIDEHNSKCVFGCNKIKYDKE